MRPHSQPHSGDESGPAMSAYAKNAKAPYSPADTMRARTHKTRHGRHEVFSCYKSNSAYTTRGQKNAIYAGRRLTTYGNSGRSLSMFARSISAIVALS